jgi:phosphoglycolate phosphatase-like HAD superfamily hydrolase
MPTKVIVVDIDGTILNVNQRIRATLIEIGAPPDTDARRVADSLRGRLRSRFFDVFLSEKFTHLDEPIPAVIEDTKRQQALTGLPVVFLTGRPAIMRKSTRKGVDDAGIAYEELILRPRHQRMQRTAEFKVDAIKSRGYEPRLVFDDDREILSAFAAAFPSAELHLITGDATTPWPD